MNTQVCSRVGVLGPEHLIAPGWKGHVVPAGGIDKDLIPVGTEIGSVVPPCSQIADQGLPVLAEDERAAVIVVMVFAVVLGFGRYSQAAAAGDQPLDVFQPDRALSRQAEAGIFIIPQKVSQG